MSQTTGIAMIMHKVSIPLDSFVVKNCVRGDCDVFSAIALVRQAPGSVKPLAANFR